MSITKINIFSSFVRKQHPTTVAIFNLNNIPQIPYSADATNKHVTAQNKKQVAWNKSKLTSRQSAIWAKV